MKQDIQQRPKIFMMDLWAIVPYYTAYLSKALLSEDVRLTVGSISYYLDPNCFKSRGIKVDPGLLDIVGKFRLPRIARRVFKFGEEMLNLAVLGLRFTFSPPDVIHVQYLPMLKWKLPLDFWFLEYCRTRGSKIILTVHDLMPHDTDDIYKKTFHKLYTMVDRVICHSDHVKSELNHEFDVPGEKIEVIPHGPFFYDLEIIEPEILLRSFNIRQSSVVVLWQGIIFPYKGIDLLLNAWQQVEVENLDVVLIIAGTGAPELLAKIKKQIAELGLKDVNLYFKFVSTEELVQLYKIADIVVYPYRAITTSGALATGLALGKTIIASNLQVFRELLSHRKNALLINPEDSQEFASALLELIKLPAFREQLASKVRELNFGEQSWKSIAQKTICVYEDAINDN